MTKKIKEMNVFLIIYISRRRVLMKKFISLMNAQSVWYLWNNSSTRNYLEKIIANIIGEVNEYQLLDTFNDQNGNLKSYIFLESNNVIIHLDFKQDTPNSDLINFIKLSSGKKVLTIIFNPLRGSNAFENDVYYINKNKNNINEVKLFLSTRFCEQKKYDAYGIREFIDNLDDEFYQKYLKESSKEELLKKF